MEHFEFRKVMEIVWNQDIPSIMQVLYVFIQTLIYLLFCTWGYNIKPNAFMERLNVGLVDWWK